MKRSILVFLVVLLSAGSAWASGFALIEQSASGMGNAFAGGAASADDASTIFFNPAGLTRLKGQQIVVGAHYIVPSAKFSDDGSVALVPGGAGLGSNEGGDAGAGALVPNLYYAWNMDNGFALGLGINVPFGLATDYDDEWVGRYHALHSEMATININPSVAYKVNEKLSVGFGVSAQQVKAELSKAIDFASAGAAAGVLIAPQSGDGEVALEADAWAFGWNFGLLYDVTEQTRVGFAYRSGVSYEAEGDADFTIPTNVATSVDTGTGGVAFGGATFGQYVSAAYADTDASADIDLPATASLSAFHQLNDKLALMADVTWTQWSVFEELRVEFDSALADSVTTEDWEDNMRYSVGATYQYNEQLALRCGVAYDETPIPDDHRTPRIPGTDRLWTAFGAGYQVNESLGFDFGYAHLFVDDSPVEQIDDGTGENKLASTLKGDYENSVNIASVQMNYNF